MSRALARPLADELLSVRYREFIIVAISTHNVEFTLCQTMLKYNTDWLSGLMFHLSFFSSDVTSMNTPLENEQVIVF